MIATDEAISTIALTLLLSPFWIGITRRLVRKLPSRQSS